MTWFYVNDDASDPIARAYRRLRRMFRNLLMSAVACTVMVFTIGIPAVQYNYRPHGVISGYPSAMDKLEADYWTPGFGSRRVEAGELAPGCPLIVFVPLSECVE